LASFFRGDSRTGPGRWGKFIRAGDPTGATCRPPHRRREVFLMCLNRGVRRGDARGHCRGPGGGPGGGRRGPGPRGRAGKGGGKVSVHTGHSFESSLPGGGGFGRKRDWSPPPLAADRVGPFEVGNRSRVPTFRRGPGGPTPRAPPGGEKGGRCPNSIHRRGRGGAAFLAGGRWGGKPRGGFGDRPQDLGPRIQVFRAGGKTQGTPGAGWAGQGPIGGGTWGDTLHC